MADIFLQAAGYGCILRLENQGLLFFKLGAAQHGLPMLRRGGERGRVGIRWICFNCCMLNLQCHVPLEDECFYFQKESVP